MLVPLTVMHRPLLIALLFPVFLPAQLDQLSRVLGSVGQKYAVTEIAISTPDPRVRPLEAITLQMLAYGKEGDKKVRLRRSNPRFTIRQPNGGWVSKPFSFQGEQPEKFFEESNSAAWNVIRDAKGEFVTKDTVLYTAPESPGTYTIEAVLDGAKAEIALQVTPDAPARRKAETRTFPQSPRPADPYRPLAEHYAPFIAQETWFQPKSDYPARFDYDGDWHGDNNWDNLEEGSSQAYVYYAAMETATHWFLIYNVFHPRDYSDRCIVGTCHENDNEGLIVTVRKDGTPFGKLEVLETLAHNNVYTTCSNRSYRNGVHNIDGDIELYEGSHPVVFIESGGHGIYGSLTSHSRFTLARGEFSEGTGVTLVYKGVAERPKHPNDRLVGYELLPIYEEWWLKTEQGKWSDRTFDAYYQYQPLGDRPALRQQIGGAFLGRKEASNSAKPFWGWHDSLTLKKKVLSVGQWALDPAYSLTRTLAIPASQPFSTDYVFNPYLGIGQPPAGLPAAPAPVAAVPAPAQPSPTQPPPTQPPPPPDASLSLQPAPPPDAAPGPAPVAAPPSLRPAPDPEAPVMPAARSGQLEVGARIDGVALLIVEVHAAPRFEVLSGQPVANIDIKGLTPGGPATWTATRLSGRGTVTIAEAPSADNAHTVKVRIEDPRSGAGDYRIRLDWKR